MNIVKRMSVLLAVLALAPLSWGQIATNESPLSLAIDLVDGSRLMGVPGIASIPVQTAYAKLDVALTNVLSIKMEETHKLASFEMRNSDRIKGTMILKTLNLQTAVGKVSLGLEQIAQVEVISGGSGKGLLSEYRFVSGGSEKGLLAEYLFDGNANDSSGNGNNGNVHGATLTKDRYGNDNSAYYFKDANTFITASDRLFPDKDNPRSLSCWIYIDAPPEVGANLLMYGTPAYNESCGVGLDWRVGRRNASYSPCGAAFLMRQPDTSQIMA